MCYPATARGARSVVAVRRAMCGLAPRAAIALSAAEPAADRPAASDGAGAGAAHLIRNHGNRVEILRCTDASELAEAAERFGHLPQVCFAGESNAGKSSMLNHLVGQRVTRSSSVAGKTRSIDWIVVNDRVVLTDLPGLPARDGQTSMLWDSLFEPLFHAYMDAPCDLRAMLLLHDIRWRISSPIRDFVDEMRRVELPMLLVCTKDDQIDEPSGRTILFEKLARKLDWHGPNVHYAATNETPAGRKARRQVLRYIETFVEAGSREAVGRKLDELGREREVRRAARDASEQ